MSTDTRDELRKSLVGIAEAAKLAGFNANTLSYKDEENGYSNQMEGYYDTKDAVRALELLINSEVNQTLDRLTAEHESMQTYKLSETSEDILIERDKVLSAIEKERRKV